MTLVTARRGGRRLWKWSRAQSRDFEKSFAKHDFQIDIDSGVELDLPPVYELNLFLVDYNVIRFGDGVLILVLGVGLVTVVDGCSGSADPEPLSEVVTLRQRRCGSVSGARQSGRSGWRARPTHVQRRDVRRARDLHLVFFEHRFKCLEELRSV